MIHTFAVTVDALAAWRAPAAGLIAQFLYVGYNRTLSLLLITLHEDCDFSEALMLPAAIVSSSLEKLLAPLAELISRRFSGKTALLCSFVISFASLIVCYAAPLTGPVVVAFLGVGMGVAGALSPVPIYNITAMALRQNRGFAISVVKAGASLGSICFPPLFVFLVDRFGSRGGLLVIAAIFCNLLLSVVLLPSTVIDGETGEELVQAGSCRCTRCGRGCRAGREDGDEEELDKLRGAGGRGRKGSTLAETKPLIVRTPLVAFFCCLVVGCIFCFSQQQSVYSLFADELGLPAYTIALTLSVQSIVDLCWRILVGLINDRFSDRGRLMLTSAMVGLGGGVALTLGLSGASLHIALAYSVSFGLALAQFAASWVTLLVGLTDVSHLARAMSVTLTAAGVCSLATVPLLAEVKTVLGSYQPLVLLYAGGLLLLSASYMVTSLLFSRCKRTAFPVEEMNLRGLSDDEEQQQ